MRDCGRQLKEWFLMKKSDVSPPTLEMSDKSGRGKRQKKDIDLIAAGSKDPASSSGTISVASHVWRGASTLL